MTAHTRKNDGAFATCKVCCKIMQINAPNWKLRYVTAHSYCTVLNVSMTCRLCATACTLSRSQEHLRTEVIDIYST